MRTAAVLLGCLLLGGCIQEVSGDPASPVPSARASMDRRDMGSEPRQLPIVDDYAGLSGVLPREVGRPAVVPPSPHLVIVPRSPQPTRPPSSGHTLRGTASWYDDGPGLYAAAGPALRVGDWRGRAVLVSANGHRVLVVLSDWCQCYFRTSRERVIDLSPTAFSRLAPLSAGVVRVEVSW